METRESPPNGSRTGRKQEKPMNPERAAALDDPARFEYLPPDDVFALLDAPDSAFVVDFGAGTGTYAIELTLRRPDVRIVALDVQPAMLELLRSKPQAATIATATVTTHALEALRGTVDRVMAINVLHEIDDDDIATIGSMLAPGGRALIVDWDAGIERTIGPRRDHAHTESEALARIARTGLRIEAITHFAYHFAIQISRVPDDDEGG